MDINIENTTFIIVAYKSEKIIYNCLNSLPENSIKIIIENSKNLNLKNDLERKYKNLTVLLNENSGFGASNNLGIKKCATQFAYILNPDVTFQKDTFDNLSKSCLDTYNAYKFNKMRQASHNEKKQVLKKCIG